MSTSLKDILPWLSEESKFFHCAECGNEMEFIPDEKHPDVEMLACKKCINE